ncbi:protein shisa-4 isoform X1 [Cetorhinus maximus]
MVPVPVPLSAGAGPLLATLLILGAVSADNDCLWYTDKQGNWHSGFDCPFFKFCCGNCTYRYCCVDPMQLISEKQQKYCMSVNLSSTTVAGIASAILLFIVIVGILVCCFLCSCCYLYRRRHQMRLPFTGTDGDGWSKDLAVPLSVPCCWGTLLLFCSSLTIGSHGEVLIPVWRTIRWKRGDSQFPYAANQSTQHASWSIPSVSNSSWLWCCRSERNDSQLPNAASLSSQYASCTICSIPISSSLQRCNCSPIRLIVAGKRRSWHTLPIPISSV